MKIYAIIGKSGEVLGQFIVESDDKAHGWVEPIGFHELTPGEVYAIVEERRSLGDKVDFLEVKDGGKVSYLELIKK